MKLCPCKSSKRYMDCCGLYIKGKAIPQTPEALMRSRYSAFHEKDSSYIKKTMRAKALENFNMQNFKRSREKWIGLRILHTYLDATLADVGYVEFIAKFIIEDQQGFIHEVSKFHKYEGLWYYVDGLHSAQKLNDE